MAVATPVWRVDESQLADVDEWRALDLLCECFVHAQGETFARSGIELGLDVSEVKVRERVAQMVKMTFTRLGHDFDKPTRFALRVVVDALAKDALAWGTPEDVVTHHRSEFGKVLAAM